MEGKQTENVWVKMNDELKSLKGNYLEDTSVYSPALLLLEQQWMNTRKKVGLYFSIDKLESIFQNNRNCSNHILFSEICIASRKFASSISQKSKYIGRHQF